METYVWYHVGKNEIKIVTKLGHLFLKVEIYRNSKIIYLGEL